MKFATNLREARKGLRLTQTELGKKIGVSQRSIANYESGKVVPHRPTLEKLASVLNMAVEDLMVESGETPACNAQRALVNLSNKAGSPRCTNEPDIRHTTASVRCLVQAIWA